MVRLVMKGKCAIQFALQGGLVALAPRNAVSKQTSVGSTFHSCISCRESTSSNCTSFLGGPHPMTDQGWDINAYSFWDNLGHFSSRVVCGFAKDIVGSVPQVSAES